MATLTIDLDDGVKKIITRRAKSNFLSLKEQVEDILRKSAIRTKANKGYRDIKCDDRLVAVFSRQRSGRKPKVKKKK